MCINKQWQLHPGEKCCDATSHKPGLWFVGTVTLSTVTIIYGTVSNRFTFKTQLDYQDM